MEVYPVLFSERDGYPSPMPDRRNAFVKGYEQAEKDLALTWEDIKAIDELLTLVYDPDNEKDYYQRVLEEFNKRRQDK